MAVVKYLCHTQDVIFNLPVSEIRKQPEGGTVSNIW